MLVIGIIAAFFYREYADFSKRHREMAKLINPSSYLYGAVRYWHLESFVFKAFMSLDKDAELKPYDDAKHTVFIMVVGETAVRKVFR